VLVRRGKVVYFEPLGQRDPQSGAPMTKDAIFRLYSMTKPFTSVAMMMLLEDGHNGVTLRNPRLGFVCTGQTVDGDPGLEGYYLEHDRDLAPDERVRFARGERMPDFDAARAPRLDPAIWPPARLDTVVSRYAMEYVRTFARYLATLLRAQGEEVAVETDGGQASVRLRGWRLTRALEPLHPDAFEAWCELWHGALAVHDRRLRLEATREPGGDVLFRVAARPAVA